MRPVADRFWAKVSGGSFDECWEWQAGKFKKGYGMFTIRTRTTPVRAHRWAYEALIAPIPAGLELDHLCRNKGCVNPWHLEPVTRLVNQMRTRRPACKYGHEWTPENTYYQVRSDTGRLMWQCRTCAKERARRAYLLKTSKVAA